MRKRPRWYLLLAAFLGLALIAAACGNDDDDDGTAAEGDTAEETTDDGDATEEDTGDDAAEDTGDGEEATGDLAGTTVTIIGPETGAEAEGFVEAFAPFEERTGIEVQYTGSRDATTELNLALEAGEPPDIVIIPQPGRIVQFADTGDAVPLPQSVLDAISGDYDPFWFELVTGADGQVYGVPNKGDVKSLVYYRPDVFEENGYEVPTTWDEFEALVQQIRDNGQTPFCVGIESGDATGWVFTDWMEDIMLRLHGPEVYDQWVSHEIPFNDPRVVEVAEFVGDIWFEDGNVLGGRDLIAATGFKEAALPIADGECILHRQANFAGAFFTEIGATLGPDGDVNVFYLPTISDDFGQVLLGAGTHAVGFADRPEVIAALEYLGTPEYADTRIAADKGGFLSPNTAHDTAGYSSEFDQILAEILVTQQPFRFDASDLMPGEVGAGSWWRVGTDYVSGAVDVQQFVDEVEDSWPS